MPNFLYLFLSAKYISIFGEGENMKRDRIRINPKPPKVEDGYRTFSIRIDKETVQALDDVSSKTGHSRNALVGLLLDYAIKHCKIG